MNERAYLVFVPHSRVLEGDGVHVKTEADGSVYYVDEPLADVPCLDLVGLPSSIQDALVRGAFDYAADLCENARDGFHGLPIVAPEQHRAIRNFIEALGYNWDKLVK